METFAQALIQGLFFFGAIGILGLPFFIWRRPPAYYVRCPKCHHRNRDDTGVCARCSHTFGKQDIGPYVRADWRGFDLVAIFLVAGFASVVVGSFLLAATGRIPTSSATPDDVRRLLTPEVLLPLNFIHAALFTVFTVWMLNGRFRWSLEDVGLRFDRLGRSVAIGAAAGLGLFAAHELYYVAIAGIPTLASERALELSFLPSNPNDPLWIVIAPTRLALEPLGGEIFYRGMVYRLFRSRANVATAIAISAFVFALTTGSLLAFVPFVAVGAVNAYLFERTGTLAPGIASSVVLSTASLLWTVGRDVVLPN